MTRPQRRVTMDVADEAGLRRWRNQLLESERDVHRTRALWRALLAIVVATAPAGAYLMQQNECLELTYAVSEIRAERRTLAEEERRLTGRQASLESLQAIERWAVKNGLERPERDRVVVLQDPVPSSGESEAVDVALAGGLSGSDKD